LNTHSLVIWLSILLLFSSSYLTIDPVSGTDEGPGTKMVGPSRIDYPQQDGGNDTRYFEYRSMWCDGYDIVNISMVKKLVAFAKANNFNCLSPLINGNYYGVYYNSTYLPKHKDVYWSFDPLMELIKEAHKYGIQVHPWFHTLYDYLATTKNPSWRVVSSSGTPASGWLNPALPSVRNYLVNLTTEVTSKYPLDGIKLDTARYPGSSYSYDAYTVAKFQSSGMSSFSDFRRLQVTECVGLIYDAITEVRPYIWVGADIWMVYSSWYDGVFQDSREWTRRGKIDYVTTMSYTTSKSSFEYYNKDIISNSQGVPVVCGPYVFVPGNTAHGTVPNETVGIELLMNQTETAMNLNSMGTCMFSYKFLNQFHSYVDALRKGPFSMAALCPLKEQRIPVRNVMWEFNTDHDREGWRVVDMKHHYPLNGVWSISNVKNPSLMTPLIDTTSDGTNVIEISMITESMGGSFKIYWSSSGAVFNEQDMLMVPIIEDKDWHLYSIHLDSSRNWTGKIRYLRLVPSFDAPTNITIDLIRIYWMPECIENCAYLGPFFSGSDQGLMDRDFLGGEAKVAPRIGDTDAGRTWRSFGMKRDLVDLRFVLGGLTYSVVYVHIYVISENGGPHELRLGTSDGMKAFLNGVEIMRITAPRKVSPDQNVSDVLLVKGMNKLLIKLAVYENELSFFVRFTRPGNLSTTDLSYLIELPIPQTPEPWTNFDYWTYSTPIWIQWKRSVGTIRTAHYEWKLDGGPLSNTDSASVFLLELEEGIRIFEVRAVDIFGTCGEFGSYEFGVDYEKPLIDYPKPVTTIAKTSSIEWIWKILNVPISGIKGFYVQIECVPTSGDRYDMFEEETFVQEPRFTLSSGVMDTYSYRIKVKVVSNGGLSYTIRSEEEVKVDLRPPTTPQGLSLYLIDRAQMQYILSWLPSEDNIINGIKEYEVFMENGNGTYRIGSTFSTEFIITRKLGSSHSMRVRAVDTSGYCSELSDPIMIQNIAPEPSVEVSVENNEGYPLHISTNGSYDPDGMIVSYIWWFEEGRIGSGPDLYLTMDSGSFNLTLEVIDDLGLSTRLNMSMDLIPSIDPLFSKTYRFFIDDGSESVIIVPVDMTVRKNETIIEPPVVEEPLIAGRSVLVWTITAVLIVLPTLVFFGIAYSLFEKRRIVQDPHLIAERYVKDQIRIGIGGPMSPIDSDEVDTVGTIQPNMRDPIPFNQGSLMDLDEGVEDMEVDPISDDMDIYWGEEEDFVISDDPEYFEEVR
jgi:uncharacterized lipoprotein YddW (UPF0748 family)